MNKKSFWNPTSRAVAWALLVSSGMCIFLYTIRSLCAGNLRYWYLIWNLFLAWLPILFGYLLVRLLQSTKIRSKRQSLELFALGALWLGFLPNTFYLVSDLIHLEPTGEVSLLFDAVLLMFFAWTGLLLGFISVYTIHVELRKRVSQRLGVMLIGAVFILSSFAIYLGRFLIWNTWDIIINPGGILLDISDRVVHPTGYPTTFTTTALFSVVLLTMYYTVYKLVVAVRGENSDR
jgi:uncharacterized membrane protein